MQTTYPLSATATLEIASGDISNQKDLDAVVIFLSSRPQFGAEAASGDADKAQKVPGIALPAIHPGQAVVSTHFKARSPMVIASLAPVFGVDLPSENLLKNCYRNAISLAESQGAKSIGFSGISGLGFYYPTENVAETAIGMICELTPTFESLRTVRFLLLDSFSLRIYREACNEILGVLT
jgi:O-acetyl-ADP-ribose deacetylase (regulator of RNase III)